MEVSVGLDSLWEVHACVRLIIHDVAKLLFDLPDIGQGLCLRDGILPLDIRSGEPTTHIEGLACCSVQLSCAVGVEQPCIALSGDDVALFVAVLLYLSSRQPAGSASIVNVGAIAKEEAVLATSFEVGTGVDPFEVACQPLFGVE